MSNRELLSVICSQGRPEPQNASKQTKFAIFLLGVNKQRTKQNKV